jgi:hypothetical protein
MYRFNENAFIKIIQTGFGDAPLHLPKKWF